MSNTRRWVTCGSFIALLVALVFVPLGVRAAPTQGGTLVVGLDQEPPTLDPHASPSAVTYQIISSVTENLLYQGLDGKLVPWLATGYKVSPDGKSFTFTLRTDVKFSDGAPLTADVVKWNFDRIVNPNFKAGGALAALTGYVGSTIIDEHTVQVNFKAPYAPFLTYAAGGTLSLISPKSTPAQGDTVNQKPVGSGPFIVTEYVPKDRIVLSRNPQYNRQAPWSDHAGPPYLEKVVFRIVPEVGTRTTTVETGETQMISTFAMPAAVLTRLSANRNLRVDRNPYPGAPRIWLLNVRMPPTDDVKVRQAINYAVNRVAFAESLYKGSGARAFAPLTMHMLDDPSLRTFYPYNPSKAAQLLDEAGWKMGPDNVRQKDGKPMTLVINSINYGAGNWPEVELLQGWLRQLGIDARIKSQARPPWYEDNYRCATNGPVMFLRSVDWDGLYALFGSANIGGNFNWSCYANAEVDRLLQQGRTEFDRAKRRAIYLRIERILLEQAVSVPLVDEFSVWVIRNNVKGTKYNYPAYPVLSDVYLER
ncbi:MAG: ABC transporter substrate-binding protein [Armatimonadota bacterium]|nr:ABC transporter substrate-binding protein [Armatimonadota bacterium]